MLFAARQLQFQPLAVHRRHIPPEMTRPVLVSDIADVPASRDEQTGLDSVKRAQAGDIDAFELLYREHSGRTYALCLRLVGGDANEATELLQDVFVRAWRKSVV